MSRKLPFSEPDPAGSERARAAKQLRELATEVSRLQPQALTRSNGEEADHDDCFPANFTKGLKHNVYGLVEFPEDYRCFVEAINSPDRTLFEKHVQTAATRVPEEELFNCAPREKKQKEECKDPVEQGLTWRGWESPRAGHVYELQGPDAGAVGMAPVPRVGSSELAAEMAEVYALALLRDVRFTDICAGGYDAPERLCKGDCGAEPAELSVGAVVDALKEMPFFSGAEVTSSTCTFDGSGLNRFERNRRFARTLGEGLTAGNVFRGSTRGAQTGPYISQFMLVGSPSLHKTGSAASGYPGRRSRFGVEDGFIQYGSLIIDQRTMTHENCLDYMTDWCSWLDVQNGGDFRGLDDFEERRRFITTPRDLATYVHYDALYEAYLNACLILLSLGVPASRGFPEPSPSGGRTSFATFGGPHILSLVTEVATRCLKAVRRQKFNYHRRARPEAIGGRLTLSRLGLGCQLGCAEGAFARTLGEVPDAILEAIAHHNTKQKGLHRSFTCDCDGLPTLPDGVSFDDNNLLLPMAFPEGSPMHPAYGAGHATVAGGCVTMLKAFFEMFQDCDSTKERELRVGGAPITYVPNADGEALQEDPRREEYGGVLTIQGELDKLAANISIGRNMAGVHYYSDYYDSLRMGERIAVGILLEQAPTYGDYVESSFKSFDGDLITISGEAGSCPSLSILDRSGDPATPESWWLRHVSGREFSEDL